MSASSASVPYRTSAQTSLAPQGQPRARFPLPPYCQIRQAAYAFDQDYAQLISTFGASGPKPLNTPANSMGLSDANAILTEYAPVQDTGAGLGRFTASFARVPATWNDYTRNIAYTYPGWPGFIGQNGTRDIFTDTVPLRLQMDYFVIDPAGVLNGGSAIAAGTSPVRGTVNDSGGTAVLLVNSPADIPAISKSYFLVTYPAGTPLAGDRTNSLIPSGGKTVGAVTWYQTLPTLGHYQSWISAASTYQWSSLVWDGTTDGAGSGHGYGQLVAQDSNIQAYLGQIVCRVSAYVLAR